VVTNSDKRNRIRSRMADTGEPFNVARRNIEAELTASVPADASAPADDGADQLIEVEVGEGTGTHQSYRRHIESFWGRWIIEPVPGQTTTQERGHPRSAYYGVAETRQGRVAVYSAMTDPLHPPRLNDYDSLAEAQLPEDIRRRAAELLSQREVIHRDI
jgi:hypothetical protein